MPVLPCRNVCARLGQSEVHVWSGITIAHDDTCAIWKQKKPSKQRAALLVYQCVQEEYVAASRNHFGCQIKGFSWCTVERKSRKKREGFNSFETILKFS